MNLETLTKLSPQELVELAGKTGVKFHHRKKIENILEEARANPLEFAKLIMDAATQKPTVENHEVEKPVISQRQAKKMIEDAEAKLNTPEMIEEAIAHIKAKQPAFQSIYKDNTWHFKCLGAEDSGNIFIPIRRIVRSAEIVMRGRLVLRGLTEHFDRTAATGNNAYTNSVIV